jgi:hypothetical protein
MSTDSFVQILEAREGVYSNGHPPFMAFLWHFVDRALPGPLGMLLLQTFLLWLGSFLIARYWFGADRSLFLAVPASLIVLYPPVFTVSGVIWKDIFMLGFLMIAIGVAGTQRSSPKPGSSRFLVGLVLIAFLLFMAMLFRYNAVFAAVPLMALGIAGGLPEGQKYRVVIAGIAGIMACAVMLVAVSFVNRKLTVYSVNPWAFSAVVDVAGTIYQTPDAETRQALYQRIPSQIRGDGTLERLLETYNPHDASLLFRTAPPALVIPPLVDNAPAPQRLNTGFQLNADETKALVDLWLDCILHHPYAWLRHRVSVSRNIVGFNAQDLWSPVFMNPNGGQERVTRFYGKNPPLNRFQSALKGRFEALSKHLFYRPWVYLLLTIAIIAFCLFFWNQARADVFLIAFSGLVYEGALFVVSPTADFRYSQFMIYISVLSALLLTRTFQRIA